MNSYVTAVEGCHYSYGVLLSELSLSNVSCYVVYRLSSQAISLCIHVFCSAVQPDATCPYKRLACFP